MNLKKFNELIEKAKQASKEDFLRFVTGIYGVDECVFDHIWDVPVIPPGKGDILLPSLQSIKTKDKLLDMIDNLIASEMDDSDGCFIPMSKIEDELTADEKKKWQKKLEDGELKLDHDAIIVYNDSELQKQYEELIEDNSEKEKPKTQEEVDQIFVDYVNGVITHERCHLNANYCVTEIIVPQPKSEEINGAQLSPWEDAGLHTNEEKINFDQEYYNIRNEVLIDTLSLMMKNYQEGDSIEDCLYKIIKARNGKSQYDNMDDREVLTMYVLFPKILTEWVTFGAYDLSRENRLQKIIKDVCGTESPLEFGQLKKKVEAYVSNLEEGSLSNKQVEMLEMLGFSMRKKIGMADVRAAATSRPALGALAGSLLDLGAFMKNIQAEKTDNGRREDDDEPGDQ